jgi:hypothetical protein
MYFPLQPWEAALSIFRLSFLVTVFYSKQLMRTKRLPLMPIQFSKNVCLWKDPFGSSVDGDVAKKKPCHIDRYPTSNYRLMYVIHENYQGRSSMSSILTKLKDYYCIILRKLLEKKYLCSFPDKNDYRILYGLWED